MMYKVNLLPRELRPGIRRLNIFVTVLIIICCMALLGAILFYNQKTSKLEDDLMRKQVVLDSLEGEALRLQTIQERRQEILQSTQALQGLVSGRKETTGLVYDIDSLTPAGLSLESLNIIRGSEGGYMAVLEGKSDSASTVGIFVKALAELTYISDVELVKLRECKDEGAVTFHVIAHIGGGGE